MVIKVKNIVLIILLLFFIIIAVLGVKLGINKLYQQNYPIKYSEYVEKMADEYNIDKYLIYAVIKTESDFDKTATSNVGARGLMQIMNDTFDWMKGKLSDKNTTFDDMYIPEKNIQYGSYFLYYLNNEFQSYETAVAAYHAGRTAVAKWLKNENYSADGMSLNNIPTNDTKHYVNKVMKCFDMYKKIYDNGGK